MKKKLLISFSLIIIIIGFLIKFENNNQTIKLNNKYYNSNKLIEININDLNKMKNRKESFILYIYEDCTCSSKKSFNTIVSKFIEENNISFNLINFENINNTSLGKKIKYSPTIVIFNKGKILKYLKPDNNKDLIYYESYDSLEKWITDYVNIK